MGRLSFLLVLLTVCGPIGAADIARGKVTALAQVNSPWDRHWDYFKAKIDETPDVEMEYFIRGEVGTEEMMLTALRRNRVQIGGITMWGLSGLVFFYYSLSDFATHVTKTHQSYDQGIQVANKQWWDSLAETQRVTIADAFSRSGAPVPIFGD